MASNVRTKEGYPLVAAALRKVADTAEPESGQVHRIVINLLASGEVTYKMHARDEDEPVGGVVKVG
jgi:hypothetical protein